MVETRAVKMLNGATRRIDLDSLESWEYPHKLLAWHDDSAGRWIMFALTGEDAPLWREVTASQLEVALEARAIPRHEWPGPLRVEEAPQAVEVQAATVEQEAPPAAPRSAREHRAAVLEDLAVKLDASKESLAAAVVRAFLGRERVTADDLVEAVATDPAESKSWSTIKTWCNRTKNAIQDIDPSCPVVFHTTQREGGYVTCTLAAE